MAHPLDAYKLEAFAKYKDGTSIPITGTDKAPTAIPMKDLVAIQGIAINDKGAYCDCGVTEWGLNYVQVIVHWPGSGDKPPRKWLVRNPDKPPTNSMHEASIYFTYSSTPMNYGREGRKMLAGASNWSYPAIDQKLVWHYIDERRSFPFEVQVGTGSVVLYIQGVPGRRVYFTLK